MSQQSETPNQKDQRAQLRQFYCDSWEKHKNQKEALTPLEQQVVALIKEHPEYHSLIENSEASVNADYLPEMGDTNPFLHLSMHLGLREQIITNRPPGITELYERLVALKGVSDAEHAMMDCLGEMLWQAQQSQTLPDENIYLDCLGKI